VIASHYAEPRRRLLWRQASLHSAPSDEASIICELGEGERFDLLDDSIGWAWGYAGTERRVGYVRSEALAADSHGSKDEASLKNRKVNS
jgi:hypothetical protein